MKLIGVVVFILILGLLSGSFNNRSVLNPSAEVRGTLPEVTTDELESIYRRNFIDACLEDDKTQTVFCECALDYVVKNYTWDQRMELDRMANEEKTPSALLDMVNYCMPVYK